MKQASRPRINLKIPELLEWNETLSVFQGCHDLIGNCVATYSFYSFDLKKFIL
jgi:hypothetical protein